MSQTVKIKPSHPSQGDYVVINVDDFDHKVHQLLDGEVFPSSSTELVENTLVPLEQFDAIAKKLAKTEEELADFKATFIAFQNDVPAMEARIAELKSENPDEEKKPKNK